MFNRDFNSDRAAQGFRDQMHLDAFYAYFDHTRNCSECQKPGEPMPLDDGLQPTRQDCPVARDLFVASR